MRQLFLHMDDYAFTSSICYDDPKAALAWLANAFGFEVTMAIEAPPDQPEMCHYEMSCAGRGRIMVGGRWDDLVRSPRNVGGVNTQTLHVLLEEGTGASGLDKHCERARAAGAIIEAEPSEQFYGDRTYRAVDPEGHRWSFAAHIREVTRAEAEKAIGQTIVATDWK